MAKITNQSTCSEKTPCVDNCCLDEHDMCLGCGRLLSEIVGWSKSTAIERQQILGKCRERQMQRELELKQRLQHN